MCRRQQVALLVSGASALALVLAGCPAPATPPSDDAGLDAPSADAPDGAPLDATVDSAADAADCDVDGDGFDAIACGGNDCADDDALRYPGNTERCDGLLSDGRSAAAHDEDCDPCTVAGAGADGDADADLHRRAGCENPWLARTSPTTCDPSTTATDAAREVVLGTDCNDDPSADGANVHPRQTEACNDRDDDCDLATDEGASVTVFPDSDLDGYGTGPGMLGCAGTPGTAPTGGDCDDTDVGRNPAVPEVCDGIDNDCDGVLDGPGEDVDGDGAPTDCGGLVTGATDCNDFNPAIAPGMVEICNRRDDDCNGRVDETFPSRTWCFDCDADGVGGRAELCSTGCAPQYTIADLGPFLSSLGLSCAAPGWATAPGDCDDEDSRALPGGIEVCDGADNDCNGTLDDGFATTTYYEDADGDAHGLLASPVLACAAPRDHVAGPADDCDDSRASRHPGAVETCNVIDDDCNGVADEGLPLVSIYADCDGDGAGALHATLGPSGSALACGTAGGDLEALSTTCGDMEGMAWSSVATDCDDADPTRQSGC